MKLNLVLFFVKVRLLMKSHAFIRHNIPNVIKADSEIDETDMNLVDKETLKRNNKIVCPIITKYFYFMFAPTLVYRDEYPRLAFKYLTLK
jgi:hypothetical protein